MAINSIIADSQYTSIINDRVLADFADDAYEQITYDEDQVSVTIGKNGNTIYQVLPAGKKATIAYRVIIGSSDDIFLNNLLNVQNTGVFTLIAGSSSKLQNDGAGGSKTITYTLEGGVITKGVDSTMQSSDNKDVAVATYNLTFSSVVRTIS